MTSIAIAKANWMCHFQVCQIVPMPAHHFPVGSSMTTLHLCSDGTYLYWVWSPASLNEKTQKGHSVFMDVFHLSVSTICPAIYSSFSCFQCVYICGPSLTFSLPPVLGVDTDRVVRCRHLAGEGYSYSQGRRVFKVLEWASLESNVPLPGLPFCHIGCSNRLCNHQHCQRGTIR